MKPETWQVLMNVASGLSVAVVVLFGSKVHALIKTIKDSALEIIAATSTPDQVADVEKKLRREMKELKASFEAQLETIHEDLGRVKTTSIVTRQVAQKTYRRLAHPDAPEVELDETEEDGETRVDLKRPDLGRVELEEIPVPPIGKVIRKP